MIEIAKEDCCGCAACANICPTGAVSMAADAEGFLYPRVDADKCTQCHLCEHTCPALAPQKHKNTAKPLCFAACNADDEIRKRSSSGGVFTLLAGEILKNGGAVCGAAFDEASHLRHIIIDDEKELPRLCGSKYVQSEIGSVFADIQRRLKQGQEILFVGTPCQAAGLRAYLRKEYDTLYIADLVCHGVPSAAVFERYLKETVENCRQVSEISFRDKSNGWKQLTLCVKDGDQEILKEKASENSYMNGFLGNLFLRPSCSSCKYTSCSRIGDITLGDFWGIHVLKKKLDDDKGTSLLLINNRKGRELLEKIRPQLRICEERPLKDAVKGNPVLSYPCRAHAGRSAFFNLFSSQEKPVADMIEECLGKRKVGIMNFHYSNVNFGAVMVPFALCKAVRQLGYQPEVINFVPDDFLNDKSGFEDFRNKFMVRTKLCRTKADLERQSKNFERLIVGADQVWRWTYNGKYMLNWAYGNKTLISYAPSFGSDIYEGKEEEIKAGRELLARFDAVSVREKSGVKICKDIFKINAEQVLDPTLLLNAEDYQEIIDNEQIKPVGRKYIGFMLLDEEKAAEIKQEQILPELKKDYLFVDVLRDGNGKFNTVGTWLDRMKNAEYIIADSFHACVFAILFKKPFVCITRDFGGNSRIESLFDTLHISRGRFCKNLQEIRTEDLQTPIDYPEVYRYLEENRRQSRAYLEKALKIKPTHKPYSDCEVFKTENIYLFGKLPLVKIKNKNKQTRISLCGLPLFKVKHKNGQDRIYLFNFLPLFSRRSVG